MLDSQPNINDQSNSVSDDLTLLREFGQLPEMGLSKHSPHTPNVDEEITSFTEKTLKEDSARQDHDRSQKWKNHFNKAFIIAFWFLWACFIFMVFALIFHWVTPEPWHWLKAEQLDKIKTVIMAALVSKAVTNQQEKLSKS